MSTQTRNSGGGGGRSQKKSNTGTSGGGENATQASAKKTNTSSKTEKEKPIHQKQATPDQLRFAQLTASNAVEDPQMSEKVATLIEMTQRSEEEVCCALYECDYNLERAVVFLLETLPVGAFETSSKKKKNKVANAEKEAAAAGDGDWNESNSKADKREKSRNRSSNRGGRGATDSRGWRGREARENEKNLRESRGDRGDDRRREYRGDRWNGERRGGRAGGRAGGRGGGRGERGGAYSSRQNASDDHQEVELWDNTIAQNAEKQQNQTQDDAWGDWDNEEYVGSLKDSKVFTPSHMTNQTVASVVSGTNSELPAPPGLEHHLGTSGLSNSSQQGSHLGDDANGGSSGSSGNVQSTSTSATTPIMQYSAAVTGNQIPSQPPVASGSTPSPANLSSSSAFTSGADTFSNAATAAANLVQQVQQQQQQQQQQSSQLKSSATLSAEQSQYFNSLSSQNAGTVPQQPQQSQIGTFTQNTPVQQYSTTYANVFGTGAAPTAAGTVAGDVSQLNSSQQPHVRRARAKLPPPSKIPSTAVEMPGDNVNNIGFLDVQFGGLDFGTDDTFDALSDKFSTAVSLDHQQQQQQAQVQDVANDYQSKSNVQQQQQQQQPQQPQQQQTALTTSLQSSQIGDALSANFTSRTSAQQAQQVASVSGGNSASTVGATSTALDTLTKNDPYNQANTNNSSAYQSSYQSNATVNKTANVYQPTAGGQSYNSSNYTSVQSSVASTYQPQSYGAYQQNSVNSYQQQQQQGTNAQTAAGSVAVNSVSSSNSTQNIPVGGNGTTSSSTANSNSGYLSSTYPSQQSAYQSSQSVYGGTSGLSNSSGFAGSTNSSSSQYSNFSTSAKLKDNTTSSSTLHFDSPSSNSAVSNTGGTAVSSAASSASTTNVNNNASSVNSVSVVSNSSITTNSSGTNNGNSASSVVAAVAAAGASSSSSVSASAKSGTSGMVPNIQMVSQYIQTGLPYYQQPVYSYEDIQMMQQRVPHVQGYYDLNYTPTSLGTGRDNLGSVAYSMTDGRFARTDNNSSPVSSSMSQQAGSSGPMLNVPYAYFYGGNVMPGSFQYGTPAIYPQQIPAANTASGGQFPKPSYNAGYGSTSYDALSQTSQDYTKGAYPSSVNQQTKSQNVTNPPQAGTSSDITSSMYGKGHVALNKVNSYDKQNFHSGTPPPFNMPNTQAAGGTSAQPYGMYLPMPTTGHHNMIHQPIHQMDGRIHSSSRRDSNSTGQRQQTNNQSKSASKQGYSPSYWTGQN